MSFAKTIPEVPKLPESDSSIPWHFGRGKVRHDGDGNREVVMTGIKVTVEFEDGTSLKITGDAVCLYDESGEISGAIAAFGNAKEKKIQQELQQAHDELEKRVEERTVELQSSLLFEKEQRMQTAAALREREELLIRQSCLATMGEMVENIVHQWRQPLNTVGLLVQELVMLTERREMKEQYLSERLRKVSDLVFHMSDTINAFRYFFCRTTEKTVLKAEELIAMTLSVVEDTLTEDNIKVEVEVIGAPALYGHANQLSQVLLNILLNCRDALLELENCEDRTIRLRTLCQNGRTIITVADNAGGIAEDIIEKVFDQYVTTKGPDKGSGIGLFIAKSIVEKHRAGSFTVRNVGPGAEFRIEIDSCASV